MLECKTFGILLLCEAKDTLDFQICVSVHLTLIQFNSIHIYSQKNIYIYKIKLQNTTKILLRI